MAKDNVKLDRYYIEYDRLCEGCSVTHHIRYFNDYFSFVTYLRNILNCNLCHIVSVYKD